MLFCYDRQRQLDFLWYFTSISLHVVCLLLECMFLLLFVSRVLLATTARLLAWPFFGTWFLLNLRLKLRSKMSNRFNFYFDLIYIQIFCTFYMVLEAERKISRDENWDEEKKYKRKTEKQIFMFEIILSQSMEV